MKGVLTRPGLGFLEPAGHDLPSIEEPVMDGRAGAGIPSAEELSARARNLIPVLIERAPVQSSLSAHYLASHGRKEITYVVIEAFAKRD